MGCFCSVILRHLHLKGRPNFDGADSEAVPFAQRFARCENESYPPQIIHARDCYFTHKPIRFRINNES